MPDIREHEQVCVRANVLIDKTIAPLIEALVTKFPNIVTKYSCEDNRSDIERNAGYLPRVYIVFTSVLYKHWEDLCDLCHEIAKAIAKCRYAEVFVRWREGTPIGMLEFHTEDTNKIIAAVNSYESDLC